MESALLHMALQQRILPAVTVSSLDDALPVAEALLRAGLPVMEVTFRTGVAAGAIRSIRKNFPEMYIGAGTLLTIPQMKEAVDVGAQFGLAPGFNPVICQHAIETMFPFIPGVMTPSEIELTAELGFKILKLFPAAQLDGIHFLKAMQAVYTQLEIQFIPMGGVTVYNMSEYLHLKNVIAIGGSWLASAELMAAKQFKKITEQVIEALLKVKQVSLS